MELGDEFYTLTDEDGNEYKFEMIGRCELGGNVYYAFMPFDEETTATNTPSILSSRK